MAGDECDFLLVDDHPLLQQGLAAQLRSRGHRVELGETSSRLALLNQVEMIRPAVVVLDHGLPDLGDGLELIAPISDLGPVVAVLTGTIDEVMWGNCLVQGACCVLNKAEPFSAIIDALTATLDQRPVRTGCSSRWKASALAANTQRSRDLEPFERLSEREKVVLEHLIAGQQPAAIADAEFVSVATVRSQIKSILRKLGVGSQLEAVAYARRAAWPPAD